jgi:thiol-disulfide isomerase/thioredoxin
MKFQYLAIFAATALLNLGAITSCSSPSASTSDASKADADSTAQKGRTNSSIGGPLAKQLQGKPVVVDVYATWCPACQNIAPTISQLQKKYAGKVEFVVLDVSDKSTTIAAEAKAQELGLSKFLTENKTQTGSLTIVDPATGNILAQHRNNPDATAYTKILDAALTKS